MPNGVRRLHQRLDAAAARRVLRLSPVTAARLAGAPVVVDGLRLDPNIALLLRLADLVRAPATHEMPLEQGRAYLSSSLRLLGGRQPIGSVDELTIPGPGGAVRVRRYVPSFGSAPAPALVYLHGGGWAYGDLDSHDPPCRLLAEQAGIRVLSVDYRLAPEHPFPAALDDAWAVWTHVNEHAGELGIDPNRIAVGGDSAGGNLAAVVARRGRDVSVPPAFQLLIYPATDFGPHRPSRELFGTGFLLEQGFIDRCERAYLPADADRTSPDLSPVRADDLSELAPAYLVTAGFDPLRDEGEEYARRLRQAGTACELVREASLVHTFVSMVDGGPGRAAMLRAAAALRRGLR